MELVKYRDAGMNTYTWFWINQQRKICSPFFDSEDQAQNWMQEKLMSELRG